MTDEHIEDLFDAEANETLWALADNLGSVRDMVDYEGNLRLHRSFDSFGNIVEEESGTGSLFGHSFPQ